MHAYTHEHIHTRSHARTNTRTNTRKNTHVHARMHALKHARTHARTHTRTYIRTYPAHKIKTVMLSHKHLDTHFFCLQLSVFCLFSLTHTRTLFLFCEGQKVRDRNSVLDTHTHTFSVSNFLSLTNHFWLDKNPLKIQSHNHVNTHTHTHTHTSAHTTTYQLNIPT